MAGPGAGLAHRPDIVLRGFDGPQSFTLLDIKTFDVAGATHVNAQHTDARRFATHTSVASHCVNTEYGVLAPPACACLIPLTVSTHGAFGPEATRSQWEGLLRALRCEGKRKVPFWVPGVP